MRACVFVCVGGGGGGVCVCEGREGGGLKNITYKASTPDGRDAVSQPDLSLDA